MPLWVPKLPLPTWSAQRVWGAPTISPFIFEEAEHLTLGRVHVMPRRAVDWDGTEKETLRMGLGMAEEPWTPESLSSGPRLLGTGLHPQECNDWP